MNFKYIYIKPVLLAAVASIVAIAMAACGGSTSGKRGVTTASTASSNIGVLACDASFENIMEQEIDVYEFINPNQSILAMYLNEGACIDSLIKGKAQIAVLSKPLSASEKKVLSARGRAPHESIIAYDAIALIVNKDNPLNEITTQELTDILNGTYTTWNQLRPSKLGDIKVVFDHQASSTVRFMRDSLLNGEPIAANAFAQGSNSQVFEAVKNNPQAMGVLGVSWISSNMKGNDLTAQQRAATLEQTDTTTINFSDDIKVLRVRRPRQFDSFQPYQAYILDGSYPLMRYIYMVNTAPAGTASHGLYVFVTGWRGQKLILATGVLPYSVTPNVVNLQ